MKALITGASAGIGREFAKKLADRGCELILVARRKERLEELCQTLSVKTKIICMDLSKQEELRRLYDEVKKEEIDILINNAGFGHFEAFEHSDLQKELLMIDTNIRAVHILTKLFLKDFMEKNKGYILNVSSAAAFLPGPLMACYYATKAYVLRLTEAVYEEIRREKSEVYIGALCPGPVATEFEKVAGVTFQLKGLTADYVAEYAVKKMFQKKLIIIPGFQMKAVKFLTRILPETLLLNLSYRTQRRKKKQKKQGIL